MPPSPKPQPRTATAGGVSKVQNFVYQERHRREFKNADYNPRKMTPSQRKRLKASLMEHGLVETLVWNKRTGNLVGGHQRISQIDEIEGTDDYKLGVAVIDVPLQREMELNVSLNNLWSMGEFDQDAFLKLLKSPEAPRLEAMQFDLPALEMQFGALPELHEAFKGAGGNAAAELQAAEAQHADAKAARDKGKSQKPAAAVSPEALHAKREEIRASYADNPMQEEDYYLMVVFENDKAREAFCTRVGLEPDANTVEAKTFDEWLLPRYQVGGGRKGGAQ